MGALTNPIHLAFIAMIALIFLGPKRLPELAKSLGTGIRELRDTLSTEHREDATPIIASVGAPRSPAPQTAPVIAPAESGAIPTSHAHDPAVMSW